MKRPRPETLLGAAIAVAALALYIVTLCPTVDFIDAGELATVASTLGIAHPTGYPLFTLLAWIFVHVPTGLRVITQLNLLSAIFCSAALFVYYRLFLDLLGGEGGARGKAQAPRRTAEIAGAACGAVILALSETYWAQALSIEVYPLHLLLIAIVLLLFARAAGMPAGGEGNDRLWLAFAFVLGLSFTNHMTTILLAPACLYGFFEKFRLSRRGFLLLAKMAIPFLLGLALYLYLPLRAAESPLMNWGNPVDADRFLTHVSGKVYRVWIFSSTETAGRQLAYFLSTLPAEFGYLPLLPALIGAVSLAAGNRRAFIFTLLLLVGCILYAINYDINDIDSYFLLAYITIACWAAFGVKKIVLLAGGGRGGAAPRGILAAAAAIALLPGALNYARVDESDNRIVERYTRDMLASLEPNALILSSQWDYFVSASIYLQTIEGLRPDVTVVDKELMRRSWYYPELAHRTPWLVRGSQREIDAFLAEAVKFEHDLPYAPEVIEGRYASLIRSFIGANIRARPVYITQELAGDYIAGYRVVPWGLALRLYPDSSGALTGPPVSWEVTLPARRDKYVDGIVSLYAGAFYNNGAAAAAAGDRSRAAACLDAALRLEPGFRQAAELRRRIAR